MDDEKKRKLSKDIIGAFNKRKPTAATLTKVIADWQVYFFELKRYKSGQKLLKRIGPVVIGVELEKFLSYEYRPRFVLYNLINSRSNTLITIIDQVIKDERGLDATVEYAKHSDTYLRSCELLNKKSRVTLFGKVTVENIIKGILSFVENDMYGNCFWSCDAVMQLSRLLNEEHKREEYFDKAVELVRQKVPSAILEACSLGTEKWINDNRSLTINEINSHISDSIRKFKFEDIPEY